MEGELEPTVTLHQRYYGEQDHGSMWPFQERPIHNDIYGNASYPPQEGVANTDDANSLISRYLKTEEQNISLSDMAYFVPDGTDPSIHYGAPLQGDDAASMAAAFRYGFNHSVQPQGYGSGSPSFMLTSDPHLRYPPPTDSVPRFVSPAQIAPSMSPAATLLTIDGNETTGLDPRYTVGDPALLSGTAPESPSSQESVQSLLVFPRASPDDDGAPDFPKIGRPPKRRRTVSFTSSSSSEDYPDGDSERDTDDVMEDDDDEDYVQGGVTRTHTRRRTVSSTSSGSQHEILPLRRVAPPVPVPNLTKKSRGRRVPTAASVLIEDQAEKVSLLIFHRSRHA